MRCILTIYVADPIVSLDIDGNISPGGMVTSPLFSTDFQASKTQVYR